MGLNYNNSFGEKGSIFTDGPCNTAFQSGFFKYKSWRGKLPEGYDTSKGKTSTILKGYFLRIWLIRSISDLLVQTTRPLVA